MMFMGNVKEQDMSLPDEYSVHCSKCSAHNIQVDPLYCSDCLKEHFIAKEDMKEFWDSKKVLFPREFKQDLLDMVGEDRKILKEKEPKNEEDWDIHCGKIWGYNQAKAEIRERINAINEQARGSYTK